jgi:hypothetical protein
LFQYVANRPTILIDPSGEKLVVHGDTDWVKILLLELCKEGNWQFNFDRGEVVSSGDPLFCDLKEIIIKSPCGEIPKLIGRGCAVTSMPISCCCICDAINSKHLITITGHAGVYTETQPVPKPGPRDAKPKGYAGGGPSGARIIIGKNYNPTDNGVAVPMWQVLGHELCGHALPLSEGTHVAPGVGIPGDWPPEEIPAINKEIDIVKEHPGQGGVRPRSPRTRRTNPVPEKEKREFDP